MASVRDYYKILGLGRHADQAAIKRAYRRLALKHHPDVAGRHSPARFLEIQEAYAVLSDPEKRRQYDAVRRERDLASPGDRPARAGAKRAGRRPGADFFRLVVEGLGLSIGVRLGRAGGDRRRRGQKPSSKDPGPRSWKDLTRSVPSRPSQSPLGRPPPDPAETGKARSVPRGRRRGGSWGTWPWIVLRQCGADDLTPPSSSPMLRTPCSSPTSRAGSWQGQNAGAGERRTDPDRGADRLRTQ